MKELDLLLTRFVDDAEADLAAGQWPELESLLELEDDVLWDAVLRPEGADRRFAILLGVIRERRV